MVKKLAFPMLTLLVTGISSCGPDAPPPKSDPPAEQWRLGDGPLAVIGDEDVPGDVLSGGISGLLLADGSIAVADGGSREIRIFDEDGALTRTLGGEGEGPGEFRNLTTIRHGIDGGICGWDNLLARVTCLTAAGAVQKTIELQRSDFQQVLPAFVGVFDDTSIIMRDWLATMKMKGYPNGERRDSVRYIRFDTEGNARVLAGAPGEETFFLDIDGTWDNAAVQFGRKTVDGMDMNRLVIATNDSLDLRVYDSSGSIIRQVRRGAGHAPVTDEMLGSARAAQARKDSANTAWNGNHVPAEIMRHIARLKVEMAERLPHRETLPAFEDVRLDHLGRIWLGAPHPLDTDVREWKILDEEFNPVSFIQLPARAGILDIGADRILLLLHDELGVEAVQLWVIEGMDAAERVTVSAAAVTSPE